MHRRFALWTGTCLGALLLAACAPSTPQAADSAARDTAQAAGRGNWPADSVAILSGLAAMEDGWNRADVAAHLAAYADTATFVIPTGNGEKPPVVVRSVAGGASRIRRRP